MLIEVDSRGDFLAEPIEVDARGWKLQRCDAHSYIGVPPCPHADCLPQDKQDRGKWVGVRMLASGYDERVFVREGDAWRETEALPQ